MNLHTIEEKILLLCPYVQEIVVTLHNGRPFATIYPNFQTLKSAYIINIESEIRWYGVELYNMEVEESRKVRGYIISTLPLPRTASGEFDTIRLEEIISNDKTTQTASASEDEPADNLYQTIKSHLSSMSHAVILPSSHLELDLKLDSLDYVELFVFIEHSYGVKIDEKTFSALMIMNDLYKYIKEHKEYINPTKIEWDEILNEEHEGELIFSPFIMFTYKTLLLPFFKLFFRLEVNGVKNIPSSSCIIAPTHQSMLDGFLIEATLPYKILKNTFFLAFKQVFGTIFFNPIAKHGQSILIDANINLKETMQHASLPLKKKKNLVIFPEGARTRDRKLLEFRPFFAMLSKTHNVPIVPVIIDGSFEALPSGKIFPRPRKIKLTYLKPIYPKNMTYSELTNLVKSTIEEQM
ncbi:phospholipid/glycerol acyltransferase [Sulfurimonas gotlandica GD1]|jgi:long-chain acyl-CoA synthetase|uniref:Phospholipid/glycerol acyltransferase n=1 Tax=Sulfurimonas gotlandica (strain DSM 19862 / JCM 16533 / GD1) TaxID=929558 RepID=B6BLX2_SULGG|nr:1-acyl-sn-glycerol-3-phosphate acyltransferase [Sulfurimonas gotlandica]EDZ61700.1 phospholipid/glycerol acyltransferase [Sulfurimonas gotlandica GD1]EHP29455.1 phospholipid/glycerol acyltransferase [Sulfurimonas gotlandica GD1]